MKQTQAQPGGRIVYNVRAYFRTFLVDNNENTEISWGKQKITPGEAHLVIGLGGAGTDMLLETKGMINLHCCADNDQNSAPERVAYLAFDSDTEVERKASGSNTGRVRLNEEEATVFCRGNPAAVNDHGGNQERFQWFDERIHVNYQGMGSGAVRQVGRMLLFLDMETAVLKLRDAIRRLVREDLNGGTRITALTIDILTGIAGGTGSGTFLDMAYIVRKIAEEELHGAEISGVEPEICGYFMSPETALVKADGRTAPLFMRNGGAALQELEKAMNRARTRGYYSCLYSTGLEVHTRKAPFNFVYLLSAYRGDENVYQKCVDSAAGSILSQVTFADPLESARARTWRYGLRRRADRFNPGVDHTYCYMALSCVSREIPPELITKSVFTAVFEEFNDDRFFTEPGQEGVDKVFRQLGLSLEQMMEPVRQPFWKPLSAEDFRNSDLFGKNAKDPGRFLPPDSYLRTELESFKQKELQRVATQLEPVIRESFTNPEKGPRWTERLLFGNRDQGYNGLIELIGEERRRAEAACNKLRSEMTQMRESIHEHLNETESNLIFRISAGSRRREYIQMWNEFALMQAQLLYLGILLAGTEGHRGGFYDSVRDMIMKTEANRVRTGCEVFEAVREVAAQNSEVLRASEDRDRESSSLFTENSLPAAYSVFRRAFLNSSAYQKNADQKELAEDFLNILYREYRRDYDAVPYEFVPHDFVPYDFKKLLTDFLGRWAGNLSNLSLERIIVEYCDRNISRLDERITEELLPNLVRAANSQTDVGWSGLYEEMLIAPSAFHRVYHQNRYSSCLQYRIAVIGCRFGLALRDFWIYQRCEERIREMPDDPAGLFLPEA